MAESEFSIRKKHKYDKEWDWEETKKWMKMQQDVLQTEFSNVIEDYKSYKKDEFTKIEDMFCLHVFGVNKNELVSGKIWDKNKEECVMEDLFNKTLLGFSILRLFPYQKRKLAKAARQKMEEISGKRKVIEMQIVPIVVRLDEDLQQDTSENEEKSQMKLKNTVRVCVFRVKTANGDHKFLDCTLRVYTNWENYLDNNQLPQCIMCYPEDGFLRSRKNERFFPSKIKFGEPPSCTSYERAKAKVILGVKIVSKVAMVASLCCPATWVWTAWSLNVILTGSLIFNFITGGLTLLDKIKHEENFGAALLTFLSSLGSIILTMGINKYLRVVAAEERVLTSLESVLITGVLYGLAGSQLVTFAYMTWCMATQPILSPMDVINYCMAALNMVSVYMAPKTAAKLLKKVKMDIQVEKMKTVRENERSLKRVKNKIAEKEAKLIQLRSDPNTNQTQIIEEETNLQKLMTNETQLSETLRRSQNDYLDNTTKHMEDEKAKQAFKRFREDAVNDPQQIGTNSTIDQNGRIIRVIVDIDAEKVFKIISQNDSRIQFANGESLELCVNTNMYIHPNAVKLMDQAIAGENITILENAVRFTKSYAQGEMGEAEYLNNIQQCFTNLPSNYIARNELSFIHRYGAVGQRMNVPDAFFEREIDQMFS